MHNDAQNPAGICLRGLILYSEGTVFRNLHIEFGVVNTMGDPSTLQLAGTLSICLYSYVI